MRDLKRFLVEWLLIRMVANAHESIQDEIHLKDFFFLVIDHIFLLFLTKVAWFQAERNIIQKLTILVRLWIKEKSEVVKDVIEQVMHNNSSFDLPG